MTTRAREPGPLTADVASILRPFRLRSGLTQEALAEAAGLSVQAISALENGRRRQPRAVTIDRLAETLGLSSEERLQLEQGAHRRGDGSYQQLPSPVSDFTGRGQQLAELEELLRSPYDASPGVVISAIGGMGGVGKTALAVQAANRVAAEYPDGQLYLNLRGASLDPLSAVEALNALLQALGVPPTGTSDLQVIAKRYRTALASRRTLILLDDAAGVAQVLPLIPGTAGSTVVITSRKRLSGLPGARRVDLDVLTEDEAVELLAEVVGQDLISKNHESALSIVRSCGYLPLAVRIAAGLTTRTASGLKRLAEQLADDGGRLDALTGPGGVVSTTIGLSLATLSTGTTVDMAAAKAFPLFALFDGEWFPLRAAARILGKSMDDTEDLLERLVDLHLLETPALHCYRLHDLVRDIGRSLAGDAGLVEVFHRELKCYLAMLWRLAELTEGTVDLYGTWSGESWSADAEDQTDRSQVLSWLEQELPNLVRLVRAAAAGDASERLLAVQLALGMPRLARSLMRYAAAYEALSLVVELPVELDVRLEHGRLYQMGAVTGGLGLHAEALPWSRRELPLARAIGEPTQLSVSLVDRCTYLCEVGRPVEGLLCAEESLALILRTGALTYEASANAAVGIAAGHLGQIDRQRTVFDRLTELQSSVSPVGAAVGQLMIGASLRQSRQYEGSIAALENAVERSRAANVVVVEVVSLTEMESTWMALGDPVKARTALTEAVSLAGQHPEEHREALPRQLLGQVLVELGMVAEAQAEWEKALVLYQRMADARADEVQELLRSL
jgi:transcriptional regulator with XRE-family HTH domain/tetratricopeptide (TPR) repeat protein